MSKTRPGAAAFDGSISPEPMSNGVPGVVPSSSLTLGLAVVMRADLIAAGDHVGCACLTSAPAPATCGEDIDVPEMDWNSSPVGRPVAGAGLGVSPARMFTPGAVTSGLAMSGAGVCGPREENAARTAGVPWTAVPAVAAVTCVAPAAIAFLTFSPSALETWIAGT